MLHFLVCITVRIDRNLNWLHFNSSNAFAVSGEREHLFRGTFCFEGVNFPLRTCQHGRDSWGPCGRGELAPCVAAAPSGRTAPPPGGSLVSAASSRGEAWRPVGLPVWAASLAECASCSGQVVAGALGRGLGTFANCDLNFRRQARAPCPRPPEPSAPRALSHPQAHCRLVAFAALVTRVRAADSTPAGRASAWPSLQWP